MAALITQIDKDGNIVRQYSPPLGSFTLSTLSDICFNGREFCIVGGRSTTGALSLYRLSNGSAFLPSPTILTTSLRKEIGIDYMGGGLYCACSILSTLPERWTMRFLRFRDGASAFATNSFDVTGDKPNIGICFDGQHIILYSTGLVTWSFRKPTNPSVEVFGFAHPGVSVASVPRGICYLDRSLYILDYDSTSPNNYLHQTTMSGLLNRTLDLNKIGGTDIMRGVCTDGRHLYILSI